MLLSVLFILIGVLCIWAALALWVAEVYPTILLRVPPTPTLAQRRGEYLSTVLHSLIGTYLFVTVVLPARGFTLVFEDPFTGAGAFGVILFFGPHFLMYVGLFYYATPTWDRLNAWLRVPFLTLFVLGAVLFLGGFLYLLYKDAMYTGASSILVSWEGGAIIRDRPLL